MKYYDKNDILRHATGYFFSPGAMRFFKSRLTEHVYPIRDREMAFFITTEKKCFNDYARVAYARVANVRLIDHKGRVHDVDDWKGFTSIYLAKKCAESLAIKYNSTDLPFEDQIKDKKEE